MFDRKELKVYPEEDKGGNLRSFKVFRASNNELLYFKDVEGIDNIIARANKKPFNSDNLNQ